MGVATMRMLPGTKALLVIRQQPVWSTAELVRRMQAIGETLLCVSWLQQPRDIWVLPYKQPRKARVH